MVLVYDVCGLSDRPMTPDDETERLLIDAVVKLDRAQEQAPLDLSQGLRQAEQQVQEVLRVYRENRAE
jgi:hypothetical protein